MSDAGHRPPAEPQTALLHGADSELIMATSTARTSPQALPVALPQPRQDEGEREGIRCTDAPSATDTQPIPQLERQQPPPEMPQTQLTFLLVSGRRKTMSFEPGITIGRVKELVWNAWPSEWQSEHPPAPAYLRLLYLGKILQDDDTLNAQRFRPNPAPPTIVHLSIRQIPIPSDSADLKKNKKRSRLASSGAGGENQTGGGGGPGGGGVADESGGCCGCVIC